jgi:3-deoxy-manno-octulosonate cytidylyltransferase (CMP-KDO synthetase)
MFHIVIPARYESSRLPGKPLLDIGGKPMIAHVYQRALETGAESVVVATDDTRIADAVHAINGNVLLTAVEHESGTERIAEVIAQGSYADDDIIINLQGDEPFVPVELLQQTAAALNAHPSASMASLFIPLSEPEEVFNPNIVKVVLDKDNFAMYFSRAPIPWLRNEFATLPSTEFDAAQFYRHVGIYGYRASFVTEYVQLPVSPLEKLESLEQLRVLFNGYKIIMAQASALPGQEVNTAEDLLQAREIYGFEGLV